MSTEHAVLLLDDRRVFVAANETAADLLGTTVEHLLGRRADEFMPVVARAVYPLAWKAFRVRRTAAGEYAAQREDGTLAHLAYVGFANRPVRGLHFFVLERLAGEMDAAGLKPTERRTHIQVGFDLPDDVRARLVAQADRQETALPLGRDPRTAIVAALFDEPASAHDVLTALRGDRSIEVSLATAAGPAPDIPLTLLAGRVPYSALGRTVESIHHGGGRIITNLDERIVWGSRGSQPGQ